MNWTATKLRVKCKELHLSTKGTKQRLIDQINISQLKEFDLRILKGYSMDKKIYLQIANSSVKVITAKLNSYLSTGSKSLSSEQLMEIRNLICTEALLKFYLKHDDCFYDMCQPDGTCTWQLLDVMANRGVHNITERDSCLKIANINYGDKTVKLNLITQANQWIDNVKSLPIDIDILNHFLTKANAYVSFISNFNRSKKSTLTLKSRDWLHTDSLPLLANDSFPFSIFALQDSADANDNYLLLNNITNVSLTRQFKYSMLTTICDNPNFCCCHKGHSYPLPSSESYLERLTEALDALLSEMMRFEIKNIIRFHESVEAIEIVNNKEGNVVVVDSSEDEKGNEDDDTDSSLNTVSASVYL